MVAARDGLPPRRGLVGILAAVVPHRWVLCGESLLQHATERWKGAVEMEGLFLFVIFCHVPEL